LRRGSQFNGVVEAAIVFVLGDGVGDGVSDRVGDIVRGVVGVGASVAVALAANIPEVAPLAQHAMIGVLAGKIFEK
jgi:hypothetical protein